MSIVAVPDAGRVMTSEPAPSVHVFAAGEKMPIAATAIVTFGCGARDPAVEGSTTMMCLPLAEGFAGVSGMMSTPADAATTTKFTVLDCVKSGFRIATDKFPAVARSVDVNAVVHMPLDEHDVVRAVPPTTIVELGPGLVGKKFPPCTCNVKLPVPPANALAGSNPVITIALEIVTLAVPFLEASSALVAMMVIAFGAGVEIGAV
jgi:hypothetical protein